MASRCYPYARLSHIVFIGKFERLDQLSGSASSRGLTSGTFCCPSRGTKTLQWCQGQYHHRQHYFSKLFKIKNRAVKSETTRYNPSFSKNESQFNRREEGSEQCSKKLIKMFANFWKKGHIVSISTGKGHVFLIPDLLSSPMVKIEIGEPLLSICSFVSLSMFSIGNFEPLDQLSGSVLSRDLTSRN